MSGCVIAGISVAVALLTAVIIGLLVLVVGLAYFRSSVSLQFYQFFYWLHSYSTPNTFGGLSRTVTEF